MVSQKSLRNLKTPWSQGISGNPKGRPIGCRNISTLTRGYSKFLKSNFRNGKNYQDYFVRDLFKKALSGDMRYISLILDICENPSSDVDRQIYKLTQKTINELSYE